MSFSTEQLGKKIQALEQDINRLKIQNLQDIINRGLHFSQITSPSITTPVIIAPNITDPVIAGTTTDSSTVTHTGTITYKDKARFDSVIEVASDPEDTAPSTITSTKDSDEVVFSKDVKVDTGIFGANSVKIGNQIIGEDGELTISDPLTPGLKIIDTGDARPNASHFIHFLDKNLANVFFIQTTADNVYLQAEKNITVGSEGGNSSFGGGVCKLFGSQIQIDDSTPLLPKVTNTSDIGTTDLRFKDLYLSGSIIGGSSGGIYSISRFEIASCACTSDEIGDTHVYNWDEYIGQAYISTSAYFTSHMGVHLPDGATVTALRVYGQESSKPITTYLYRETRSSGAESEMATVNSTANFEEISDTAINNATIDNDTYAYFIKIVVGSAGGSAKMRGIQIDYT